MKRNLIFLFFFLLVLPISFGSDVFINFTNLPYHNFTTTTVEKFNADYTGTTSSDWAIIDSSSISWQTVSDSLIDKYSVYLVNQSGSEIYKNYSNHETLYSSSINAINNNSLSLSNGIHVWNWDSQEYTTVIDVKLNGVYTTDISKLNFSFPYFNAIGTTYCGGTVLYNDVELMGTNRHSMVIPINSTNAYVNKSLESDISFNRVMWNCYANSAGTPSIEYLMEGFYIQNVSSGSNNLPLYNITWGNTQLYLNDSVDYVRFNFSLETSDIEGDTIYYATNKENRLNYTEFRDFRKQDCSFFACNWVNDYNDLKDLYWYTDGCPYNDTALNGESTLLQMPDQTGNTDFLETVYYMRDSCSLTPTFILPSDSFNQVEFSIYEGDVIQDKYNIFAWNAFRNTIINLTIDNINTTTSTLINNGTPILNFSINRPYYVAINFENLNQNYYEYVISDGTTRLYNILNTTKDTSEEVVKYYGVELTEGNIGINNVNEKQIVQDMTWSTTLNKYFDYYSIGTYYPAIYITDSYHMGNDYIYLTTKVEISDQPTSEFTETEQIIQETIGKEWRSYFNNLGLKSELSGFIVFLYFALLIWFSISFYMQERNLRIPIANLLASVICALISWISLIPVALLSFSILGVLSLGIIIITRGNE